jgi:hypothetical protein
MTHGMSELVFALVLQLCAQENVKRVNIHCMFELVLALLLLLLLCAQENVNRLKAYKSNLVVFPRHRNSKKPKVGGQQLCFFIAFC